MVFDFQNNRYLVPFGGGSEERSGPAITWRNAVIEPRLAVYHKDTE